MCGICGWQLKEGLSRAPEQLHAMSAAISHRGPDDQGIFRDDEKGVALAHNRLSIIDLSQAGHQPMISETGDTVLIYNGELYNFRELKAELEGYGHKFKSRTDSEVVLNAFLQWGTACVDRFYGMFAFAVWSSKDDTLFLARDPMGMKPLYYVELPGGEGFAFASEVKALLALPDYHPEINRSSLQQFMEFGYTFDTHETMLKGVFKLPPGHTLEVKRGETQKPEPFFIPPTPFDDDKCSLSDLETELYTTLSTVVKEHLTADVPVGLLLSGGLDSSIIASMASQYGKITTISMGFSDSNVDECSFARTVSEYVGLDHHEIIIPPDEVMNNLDEVVWHFDDLFADWGTFSTRLMYKKCREMGVKVVLVGEGSDELFGGYPAFEKGLNCSGPLLWKLFMLYRHYSGRRYGWLFPRFCSIMKKYMEISKGDLFHAIRLFESLNQLPNNYVMKVDKASMSVSVEARAPFLDRRIVEIACKIPRSLLAKEGTNKYILRSMARRYNLLPEEIIFRPKYGASIAASWMDEHDGFRRYARETILDRKGWVDELGLRRPMTDFFSGRSEGYSFPWSISIFRNTAWRLLLLNLWSIRYLRS